MDLRCLENVIGKQNVRDLKIGLNTKVPSNFIDRFLEHTKYAESPTSYFEFAALTTIAAVLRDNVYMKYQLYTIYPNLYVILLSAESSNTRKGLPLSICKRLVSSADNTHVIAGTATMPAIIQRLGENYTTKGGKAIEGASGLLVAAELTSFLKKDFNAVDHLTNFYDYHEEVESLTKIGGPIALKKLCLSLIAGTNEALISDLYDERAKDGGLLARSCIVYEKNRRLINSMEYDMPDPLVSFADLKQDLQHIATLHGPMIRSKESQHIMDKWYHSLGESGLSKTGVEGRIHDTVKKIAMLLAIADLPPNSNKVITGEHMEKAIDFGVRLIQNQKVFNLGAGSGIYAKAGSIVLKLLYTQPGMKITQKRLMQMLLGEVDKETLEKIIDTFAEAGYVERYAENQGLWLRCTQEFIDTLKEKSRG